MPDEKDTLQCVCARYRAAIGDDLDTAEGIVRFLDEWDAAIHPRVEDQPVVRIAILHPDRVPVTHQRVEGVPDEVLAAYHEEERYEEVELADLVAQYGGTLHETVSEATSLAMTRARERGYRVYELDPAGERTGFDDWYETLDEALRMSALGYGHPPGTLIWREVPANT